MRWPFIFVAFMLGLLIWGWWQWEAWLIFVGFSYLALELVKQGEAPW